MAITTYDELKNAIADWCPHSDMTSKSDEFIDLAESLLNRPPKSGGALGGVRVNKTRTTGTLTAGTDTLAVPSDFLEFDRFMLTADKVQLVPVTPDHLGSRKLTGSGRPRFVATHDVFEFDVSPDSAYAYELSYWPKVTALSSTNTTNYLLTNFPDVYLSACLYWAWSYRMDDALMAQWAGRYAEDASAANSAYSRRLSRGSISIQSSGATP